MFVLASGASGVQIEPETESELRFGEAMEREHSASDPASDVA